MLVASDLAVSYTLGNDLPEEVAPAPEIPVNLADALLWRVPARQGVVSRAPGHSDKLVKSLAAAVFCGLELADWLADEALLTVSARARGVLQLGQPRIEGSCVVLKVSGFDNLDGATNSCTFDFTTATRRATRTVYFAKR